MEINWLSISIGFVLGVVASVLGNWIWKLTSTKKPKGNEYVLALTTSRIRFESEGENYSEVDMQGLVESLLGRSEENELK